MPLGVEPSRLLPLLATMDNPDVASRGERTTSKSDAERQSEPEPPHRRRPLIYALAGIVALAVIGAGVAYWLQSRNYETTDDAFVDGYVTQIAPQVAGTVTALKFSDNEHVAQGQTLVLIDPRDYQVRLTQAQAQRTSAAASRRQAEAQIGVLQASLDQARANVVVAEADLVQAQQDYQRFTTINPHAVSQQQVDNATAAFHSAQAKLNAAKQAVAGAEAQLQTGQAQLVAAQAQQQQAEANVAAAALQLSYCTIVAPVTGHIAHRNVDVGNYVSPGQAMFAVVQDNVWVTANFKETQLSGLKPGQPVRISVDAVPGVTFHGRVDSFQPGTGSAFSVLPAENATGNWVKVVQRLPVKIVFDDQRVQQHFLAPGMSVEPSVKLD
ncbi:MAG TPA: HlyD family secretion protein [Acetobacteraceae bacterium]|nr:HlyD family secretion protein [Acetobacteraceae bacterium]